MKQKLIIALAFSLVLINLVSCKKNKPANIDVSGVVSNRLTGTTVKNIPVNLIGCDGIPIKCLSILKTVYTDQNGYYSISFESNEWRGYRVGIPFNDSIASTPNPAELSANGHNYIDFSQFPLKILQLNIKVLRHDKNWLIIDVGNADSYDFFSYNCYNNQNPAISLDTTCYIKIQAGRPYTAYVGLSNKTGPYTYTDNEFVTKNFFVNNTDTTIVNFTVQ